MGATSPKPVNLDIAIIGAGIAGLSAGICLKRANSANTVTIYERSEFKNEVGAAINMPPHSSRILRKWGLAGGDWDGMQGKKLERTRRMGWEDGEVKMRLEFYEEGANDEERYGCDMRSYHRADLHSGLRRLAEEELGVKVRLERKAVGIDCAEGRIGFEGGEEVVADLVVVADGVNTPFVKDIVGEGKDVPLKDTGRSAFRTLIPVETILADPEASQLFQHNGQHGLTGTFCPENGGILMILYPCRNGDLMNMALFHPTPPDQKNGQRDWNSPATIQDALAVISPFQSSFKALVKLADSMKIYSISERDPLPTYVNGKAIILGDAAHPMLPTMAGGGSTSLEDAATLEVLLSNFPSKECLPDRLRLWEAIRLPRDGVMQILSKGLMAARPANSYREEVKEFYMGHLPETVLAGWQRSTKDFLCFYDVYAEAEKAMKWAEREGWPNEGMGRRLQVEGGVRHFGRDEEVRG